MALGKSPLISISIYTGHARTGRPLLVPVIPRFQFKLENLRPAGTIRRIYQSITLCLSLSLSLSLSLKSNQPPHRTHRRKEPSIRTGRKSRNLARQQEESMALG